MSKSIDEKIARLAKRQKTLRRPSQAIQGIPSVTSSSPAVDNVKLATDASNVLKSRGKKRNRPLPGKRLTGTFPPPDPPDPVAIVSGLSDELMEFVTDDRIKALEVALNAAQHNPPADKRGFVTAVNLLLDVFRVRIRAEDDQLYRLRVQPGRNKGGESLGLIGGGNTRGKGFSDATIQLVPDAFKPTLTPESAPMVAPWKSPELAVAELAESAVASIEYEQVEALEAALKEAKTHPPADKQHFVRMINHLLDVLRVRIQADDGELYRMRVLPGRSGAGYLALTAHRGTQTRGFSRDFRLVPVTPSLDAALAPAP